MHASIKGTIKGVTWKGKEKARKGVTFRVFRCFAGSQYRSRDKKEQKCRGNKEASRKGGGVRGKCITCCVLCYVVCWGRLKGLEEISRARRPLIENVEGKEGLFGQLTRQH